MSKWNRRSTLRLEISQAGDPHHSRLKRAAITALLTFLIVSVGMPRALGIGPTGFIVGTVMDNTGAALPGVTVTVNNQATAETRTVQVDQSGNFTFPALPVGTYTVKAEKAGFQSFLQRDVVLQVDQNVSVLVRLTVGSVQTVVEVNGTPPPINLVDATVSSVVDQKRIVDLPLNGRDTLQLQYIMPGVSYDNDNVAHGQGQHEGVVVNGNRPQSNYYLLDGVDLTDSFLGIAPTFPAPDALQEFDIQTSNFNAQYGRNSGGVVNAATNSGTNEWHGDAFEFFRNDVLNAHNYFDLPGSPKPAFKLNQFGGTIGGPIQKNKTFIFGYFQETRRRRDETITVGTVLTPSQRPDKNSTGDANFGSLCPGAQCPIDPRTGAAFPNATIPGNRIDPTALNFIKALMPLPNNGSSYTFIAPSADALDDLNEAQTLGRVDHTFGSADNAFARYYFNQDNGSGIGVDNIPGLPHAKYFRNQNVAIDWTHAFSPNFLNTAVFGFTRLAHHRGPTTSVGWESFGGPGGTATTASPSDLYTSVGGSVSAGGDGSFVQNRQTWQYTDYVSVTEGKHTVALGGDFTKASFNRVEDYYTDPLFNFTGQYSGNALADLLLGLPNYYNLQTEVGSRLRSSAFDLYVDDSYRVKSNLTIDAGLRWEPLLPPVDNLNDQPCFDPSFTKKSTYYPTAPPGLLFPGPPLGQGALGKPDAGCPRQLVPSRYKNFAPRLGINWDPSHKGTTSIRAAFGIFWDEARMSAYNRFSTTIPFDQSVIVNTPGSAANNYAPSLTGTAVYTNSGVTNPYALPGSNLIPRTPSQRQAYSPSYGGNWPTSALEVVLAPNWNEGYTNQWNLSVQHEFFTDYSVTFSYIGNHGTKLWIAREYNYATPESYDYSQSLNQNLSNLPERRRLGTITCGTATPGLDGPCYGPFEEEDPAGYSNYNSFQAAINRRFKDGSTFLASYVFGRYLDIFSYGQAGGVGPRDPENFALDYGPSDNDVRHRFVASYIWVLPRQQRFSGPLNAILNGWQVQGIVDAQTGTPYSIKSNTDTAANGVGGDTADLIPGQTASIHNRSIHEYFNTAAFQNAAPGTYGNTGRNFLTGPSMINFNFSLFKTFPISEHLGRIEFRSEFFNLFNHPNFGTPDYTVGDGTFGQVLSAQDPRLTQFALKWLF